MSGLLPFALNPHPVWSLFAAKIHAAVWDRVGVEKVREFVRCWAATMKRAPLSPAWDAWETAWRGVTDPDRVIAEVMEHWGDSLEVDGEERRQLLPPSMPDRPDESTPSELRIPLPLSHDRRSTEAKWAVLAAIHDAYWLDAEKINPFPEPANQQDLTAWTAWFTAGGFVYRQLLEQALKLADVDLELAKSQRRVLDRWLKEVAGDPAQEPLAAANPQGGKTDAPPPAAKTQQGGGNGGGEPGQDEQQRPVTSPETPPPAAAGFMPPLKSDDLTILRELRARHPVTVNQYDLETATGVSRRTISGRMKLLRQWGLTHRPCGEHGGERITPKGIILLDNLPVPRP